MRRPKPHTIRNKLDLKDRTQVRLVRKRLGLSDVALTEIIDRVGNSLSAISKEAALQRAPTLSSASNVPSAAVVALNDAPDQTTHDVVSATAPAF